MIKALIFDLDNTLIDRKKAFIEGMNEILGRYFNNDEEIANMIEDILIWDHNGAIPRIDVFNKLKDKYQYTECTPKILDNDWKRLSGSTCYLFEDVRDTLTTLKKKYKLAVLSNGDSPSQRRKMATIDIYDILDYSLISGEYIYRKPDKEIFLYVAKQLGLKPEECAYIGDSYDIDVLGSRNAGMLPIYINRFNEVHNDVENFCSIAELLNRF